MKIKYRIVETQPGEFWIEYKLGWFGRWAKKGRLDKITCEWIPYNTLDDARQDLKRLKILHDDIAEQTKANKTTTYPRIRE